jgi:iron(III) transport system substrate-binding protein
MVHKLKSALALAAATAIIATGCSSSAAQGGDAAPEGGLVEAARAEGSVVWYTSIPQAIADRVGEAFRTEHGVSVEIVNLTTGLLTTRFATEMESGGSPADALTVADPTFLQDAVSEGWVRTVDEEAVPNLGEWPEDAIREDAYALVNIQPIGVSFQTSAQSADDYASWDSLLADDLAGELYLVDPANVPAWLAMYALLREELGDEYLEQLGAQDPRIVESAPPGVQGMAAGSGAATFPSLLSLTVPLAADGAAVDTAFPSPTTGVEQYAAVNSGAAHPNAATLFMSFLMTEDAQVILNEGTGSSPLGALPGTVPLPEGYVSPDLESAIAQGAEIRELLGLG